MTCIAWDGKTLAADKRCSFATSITTTTKIIRAPDGALVGCSGNASLSRAMLDWFMGGRITTEFPAAQREDKTSVDVLCIEPNGQVHIYQYSPNPVPVHDRFFAFGCGSNYALAAMYLGHDASRAVEVACALDNSCGNGIDTLQLN